MRMVVFVYDMNGSISYSFNPWWTRSKLPSFKYADELDGQHDDDEGNATSKANHRELLSLAAVELSMFDGVTVLN